MKILKTKYGPVENLPMQMHTRNGCSNIWRGLCSIWDLVLQGIAWHIGNGHIDKFWTDNWIEGMAPLGIIALRDLSPEERGCSVNSYVDSNGQWKWRELQTILPHYAILRLTSFIPPQSNNGADFIFWNFSKSGKFSTKIAYDLICDLNAEL